MTSFSKILLLFLFTSLHEVLSARNPDNCGKSPEFSVDYVAATNFTSEQFAVGYKGVSWRVFIGIKSRLVKTTVTLSFPNKPENDATFDNKIRPITGNLQGDFNCDVQKSPEVNGNQVVCQSVEHNGVKGIYYLVNFNYNLAPEHTGFTFKVHTEDRDGDVKECSVENVPVITCPANINDEMSAESASNYNGESKLTCKQQGAYPFKNQQPLTANVKCQANAKFDTDGVECWKAPSSTLVGNLKYKVGASMNLKCSFVDVVPKVDQVKYVYYKGDNQKEETILNVDQVGGYNLTTKVANGRSDQTVTCQALNLVNKNKMYKDVGLSQPQSLVILKKPTLLQSNNECTIRRSSSEKSCDQVVYSNPLVEKATLVSGNTTTEIQPTSSVGFNQTFSFAFSDFKNENGSYKLSMENSEFPGEVLSVDLNITVIDDGAPPSAGSSSTSTVLLAVLLPLLAVTAFQ